MLQVRRKKELAAPKERFNEEVQSETASIRSALAVNRLAMTQPIEGQLPDPSVKDSTVSRHTSKKSIGAYSLKSRA